MFHFLPHLAGADAAPDCGAISLSLFHSGRGVLCIAGSRAGSDFPPAARRNMLPLRAAFAFLFHGAVRMHKSGGQYDTARMLSTAIARHDKSVPAATVSNT